MGRVIANKHRVDSLGCSPEYNLNFHILRLRETHLILERASVPLLPALRGLHQDIHPLVTLTSNTLAGTFLGITIHQIDELVIVGIYNMACQYLFQH